MNVQEVRARVREINKLADDDETAHSYEDDLYEDVLQAIADEECEDTPAVLAKAALRTQNFSFKRWCA